MFRLAASKDIDVIHELLVAEARLGRFDQRLAQEPYSSMLRKNLNHIRRKGRRLDQDLAAQLLVWEKDGAVAGFVVNSAILPGAGNEILMLAVVPEFRGRGEAQKMKAELLAQLHPFQSSLVLCPGILMLSYFRRCFWTREHYFFWKTRKQERKRYLLTI